MIRLQDFRDSSMLNCRMKASYLLLLGFLFAGFVQCSNELLENKEVQNEDSFDDPYELIEYLKNLPSKAELAAKENIHVAELENENKPQYPLPPLKLIRNKFDNLTQFASGALVGESIRNGNITFARVVTYLMIADQFPPQSNWVDILTKYRGDESELDELVQEIEIFEDFVENNTISDLFDDKIAEKLVEFIETCKNVRKMAEQVEKFEGIMEKIESLDLEKSVDSWSYVQSHVSHTAILPHAVQSLSRLNANSSLKIDNVESAYEMFRQLELERKIRNLFLSIYFFDTTPSFANRTLHQQFLAMDHGKVIEDTFNITELLPLDEEFIRDCGNFLWISSIRLFDLNFIENMVNNIEHFENLKYLIDIILEVDYSEVVKPTIINETEKVLFGSSSLSEFRNISKLLKVSKSSVKIISLAKKIAKKKFVKAFDDSVQNNSDVTHSQFFNRSKLLQMFNGPQAFINSANFSKSELYNFSIHGMENIDLGSSFEIFHQNGKQLQTVENWLSKLKLGEVAYDAIQRFDSMKYEIIKNITPFANYERLVGNMKNLSNIRQVVDGYRHFVEILKWLKSNPNLISKLQEVADSSYDHEQGKLLMDVAITVRFLKKLLVVDKPVYTLNLSDFDVVIELRKHLDHFSNHYEPYGKDEVIINVKKVIETLLQKNISWEERAAEGNWTDNYQSLLLSHTAMKKFSAWNFVETRKILEHVKYQVEELNFMWKAGEAMENLDARKFTEGLALMARYNGSRNISMVNSTWENCEKLKEHLLPDILANLTNGLQVYYDSLEGIKSAEHLEYLAEQVIYMDNVPKNVEYYLGNLTIWLSESSVLEVLSKEEIDMKLQRLFRNMPNIRMSLSRLIRWIEKIPKGADKKQLGKMKKSMAGKEKETAFLTVLNFTEKVRDPEYTKAIRVIFENLEKLAKIFGYIDHSTLCQEDAFGPYGSMCFVDKNYNCPAILQDNIAHWSSQYITITEIFLCFFIQFAFGLLILLKIYQRRNSIADYELKSFGVKIKDKEIKDGQKNEKEK